MSVADITDCATSPAKLRHQSRYIKFIKQVIIKTYQAVYSILAQSVAKGTVSWDFQHFFNKKKLHLGHTYMNRQKRFNKMFSFREDICKKYVTA